MSLTASGTIFHQNCFQIESQECKLSKFPERMPPDLSSKSILSLVQAMASTPSTPVSHFKFFCYDNAYNTYVYEGLNLKPKPAIVSDLFLDQCLLCTANVSIIQLINTPVLAMYLVIYNQLIAFCTY